MFKINLYIVGITHSCRTNSGRRGIFVKAVLVQVREVSRFNWCMSQQATRLTNATRTILTPVSFTASSDSDWKICQSKNGFCTWVLQHVFCLLMKTYFKEKVLLFFITAFFGSMKMQKFYEGVKRNND